jgi:flagellar biosynthesis protein FlhA
VRTAEVTARFTLDALPGKQMAIDADLNAGLIVEHQARARREQVAREAEFYGAMDGAARFNQRDSIATILITAINILAGFLIGVFQLDIPFREALKTYTVLTVGDGLVTMIPSLLVSMAGGMIVTRASSNSTLSVDLGTQLLSRRRSLQIAAGVMVALAAIPGLPKFSFLAIAGVVALLAARLPKIKDKDGKIIDGAATDLAALPASEKDKKAAKTDSIEDLLKLDELSLEVGYALVNLVDVQQGGQLLARVKALRSSLALQLGFIVPPIHITDNVRLKPREYVISMRGVEIARWDMLEDKILAISSELTPPPLAGIPTREPAFSVAALWISRALESQALTSGYAVVDQTSVLSTHLAEVIRQDAYELLSRQESSRPCWMPPRRPKIPSCWSRPPASRSPAPWFVPCCRMTAACACLPSITTSKKNSAAPSARRRQLPPAPDCSPLSSVAFSMACVPLPEIRSRRLRPSCSAPPPRAFICGDCSNPFSPKLWCFLRWKFLP